MNNRGNTASTIGSHGSGYSYCSKCDSYYGVSCSSCFNEDNAERLVKNTGSECCNLIWCKFNSLVAKKGWPDNNFAI